MLKYLRFIDYGACMKKLSLFVFLILVSTGFKFSYAKGEDTVVAGFWNMENFYDTLDDKTKNDEEFLPGTKKNWMARQSLHF